MNITVNGESVVVRKDDELQVEFGWPAPRAESLGKLGGLHASLIVGVGDGAGTRTLYVGRGARGEYLPLDTDGAVLVGEHRWPAAELGSLTIGEPPVNEPPVDLTERLPDRLEFGPGDVLRVERIVRGLGGIPAEPIVRQWTINAPVAYETAEPPEEWTVLTSLPAPDVAAPAFVPAGRFSGED